jgi:GTP cyclohydrolase II
MILLSNTRHTIVGLEGYGLRVVEQRSITFDTQE